MSGKRLNSSFRSATCPLMKIHSRALPTPTALVHVNRSASAGRIQCMAGFSRLRPCSLYRPHLNQLAGATKNLKSTGIHRPERGPQARGPWQAPLDTQHLPIFPNRPLRRASGSPSALTTASASQRTSPPACWATSPGSCCCHRSIPTPLRCHPPPPAHPADSSR